MTDISGNANRVLAENLFAAIRQERIEDVEKYLCLGADPNYIVLNGHSPFHIAAGCKLSDRFINLMLQYDGDPNVRTSVVNISILSLLKWTVVPHVEKLRFCTNNDGLTPLHIATSWGKVGSMKLLAENGADVFTMDNEARDLKWFAEENGSPECIRLAQTLLAGGRIVSTPKSSKYIEQQSEADHRLYKENRNPNSSRYTSEDSRVRTPLHERFDDSWVAKNRGSSRRPRITSADKTPLNLCHRENDSATISEKNDDHFASANNLTYSPRSPYVTAPRSAQRVLSPGRQFFCPDNCELDTTDKCVGTSVMSTKLGLDTTDKCVGSSILCAAYEDTPTREDCLSEEETTAAANKNWDCEVLKSVQTSCCKDEQLENLGPRAVTARERVDGVCDDSDVTLTNDISGDQDCFEVSEMHINPIPSGSRSCPVSAERSAQSPNAVNMLLSTKVPLRKSEIVGLYGENFARALLNDMESSTRRGSNSPNSTVRVLDRNSPKSRIKISSPAPVSNIATNCVISGSPRSADFSDATLPNHSPTATQRNQTKSNQIESPLLARLPNYSPTKKQRNQTHTNQTESPLLARLPNHSPTKKQRNQTHTNQTESPLLARLPNYSPTKKQRNQTKSPSLARPPNYSPGAKQHNQTKSPSLAKLPNCSPTPKQRIQTECHSLAKEDRSVPFEKGMEFTNNDRFEVRPMTLDKDKDNCNEECAVPMKCNPLNAVLECSASSESASSSDEEGVSKKSIRRFAAISLHESESQSCDKTRQARLHSTVASDTSDRWVAADGGYWDVSVIEKGVAGVSNQGCINPMRTQSPTGSVPSQHATAESQMSSDSTVIYNWRSFWEGEAKSKRKGRKSKKCRKNSSEESEGHDENLEELCDSEIRKRLIAHDFDPGPIGACRDAYIKRLKVLREKRLYASGPASNSTNTCPATPKFSAELNKFVSGLKLPDSVQDDDEIVRRQFDQPDPNVSWREGTAKDSFTYLLLDPRVTNQLPDRAKLMADADVFKAFAGAIFYIGKGKQCRPFFHFTEALNAKYKVHPSQKLQHILSIWNAGLGVISLHVYQSIVACEAYTREAAMIDALGLDHLTNGRRGDYYGAAKRWDLGRKRTYGSFLLKKALEVLMVEGERQIKPSNLKSGRKKRQADYHPP